jgi:hypothetical protein
MDSGLFKVRLCTKDSSGFVGFVKTGWIFWKSVYKTNPRIKSLRIGLANPDSLIFEVGFVNHETKRTFLESGFVITIQNKSLFLQSLIQFPHPYNYLNWYFSSQHYLFTFCASKLASKWAKSVGNSSFC